MVMSDFLSQWEGGTLQVPVVKVSHGGFASITNRIQDVTSCRSTAAPATVLA